ncbi:hypothetical protein HDU98_007444, partial [Podochytrium sp. JEL0797]
KFMDLAVPEKDFYEQLYSGYLEAFPAQASKRKAGGREGGTGRAAGISEAQLKKNFRGIFNAFQEGLKTQFFGSILPLDKLASAKAALKVELSKLPATKTAPHSMCQMNIEHCRAKLMEIIIIDCLW